MFTTRQDAIDSIIIEALINSGENPDHYNIEAIADKTIGDFSTGYRNLADPDTFWSAVMDNAYPIITYTAGAASTLSKDEAAISYVEWRNGGRRTEAETAEWLAERGLKAEQVDHDDIAAWHERLVTA